MKYQIDRKVTVPFEHCDECIHLNIKVEYIFKDEMLFKMISVCKNSDICENAVKIWNKGKRNVRE